MTLSLDAWFTSLKQILPAQGIVHVGFGSGHIAAVYADWDIDTAIFIEADENLRSRLSAMIQGHSGWRAHTVLVSDAEVEMDFYVASNPNESGLVRPELFSRLWKNLKTRERRRLNAVTLDSILESSGGTTINWAVVDCVPALPVLRGAMKHIDQWDVIVARVILDESKAPDKYASKSEIDDLLFSRGFRCVAQKEELQPAIGLALYARNWKALYKEHMEQERHLASVHQRHLDPILAQINELKREREQAIQSSQADRALLEEQQIQLADMTRAHEERARLVLEQATRIQMLDKINEELTLSLNGLNSRFTAREIEMQTQIERLTQASQADRELSAELKIKLHDKTYESEKVAKDRDELARLSADRLTQYENLLAQEADLKHELLVARQSASLGVKLQTLREADLKDLQARYQASVLAQEQQHRLLVTLGERLSMASSYFHKIVDNKPLPPARNIGYNSKPKPKRKAGSSRPSDRNRKLQSQSKEQSARLLNVALTSGRARFSRKKDD